MNQVKTRVGPDGNLIVNINGVDMIGVIDYEPEITTGVFDDVECKTVTLKIPVDSIKHIEPHQCQNCGHGGWCKIKFIRSIESWGCVQKVLVIMYTCTKCGAVSEAFSAKN